ncbi:uncharacterized protein LOC124157142 [Ischnura elegans]|uniref:uncharacterized protein LOC124157142 n=1 Tax=Ischnura elegans TaxID=197161 RepID=UPI001ED8A449|nr:uncharacterized protein LOC124157142 [Ischnura elegans]
MSAVSHHNQELSILLVQLLLVAQGVNSVSHPCASAPCFLPVANIQAAEQQSTNNKALTGWNDHQLETNELLPMNNEDSYFYDSTDTSAETKGEPEKNERDEDYSIVKATAQGPKERFKMHPIPREAMVFFISRTPIFQSTQNRCKNRKGLDARCFLSQEDDDGKIFPALSKRGRYNGYQKWTSAGLPFSVLYHHKQVSRSKPPAGTNGVQLGNAQAAAQRSPENGQWTVAQTVPAGTTRKQYSTLPHLFVSYGWGPLGK